MIPVFPARSFVHSYLFVRQDSPLDSLAALAGKRVALRDFTSTGAIWFRGLLASQGIPWRSIVWVVGPKARFAPPPGAVVEASAQDPEQMLLDCTVDMFFSARVKDRGRTRFLLPDPARTEAEWFRAEGTYPIIHTVAVSAASAENAATVFDGYAVAKRRALARKLGTTMMPWAKALWDGDRDLFGGDPLPYGLTAQNRKTLMRLGQHLVEQGLARAEPALDTLFHIGSAEWREA